MKRLVGVVVATSLLATTAFAQTTAPSTSAAPAAGHVTAVTACAPFPADPTVPDGAHASAGDMQTAQTTIQAWLPSLQPLTECRRTEITALTTKWTAVSSAYNAERQYFAAFQAAWQSGTELPAPPPPRSVDAATQCAPLPPAPARPASARLRTSATPEMTAWQHSTQAALSCRAAEANDLNAKRSDLATASNASVEHANGIVAAWTASLAAYQAAHPQRRSHQDD